MTAENYGKVSKDASLRHPAKKRIARSESLRNRVASVRNQPVTQRKQHRTFQPSAIYDLQRRVKQAIIDNLGLQALCELICSTAVESAGFSKASIGRVDANSLKVTPAAAAGSLDKVSVSFDRLEMISELSIHREAGYFVLKLPIFVDGRVVAILNLCALGRGRLFESHKLLLKALADDIGLALHMHERELWHENAALTARAGKERLERAIDRVKLGIWELDVANQSGWWSKQMYELLGLENSGEVPTIEQYLECIHPEERAHVAAFLDRLNQGIAPAIREFRSNPDRGPVRTLAPTIEIDFDAHGQPVRLAGTISDVSEYRRIEAELRENEIRFRKLAESTAAAILIYDAQGIVYANPATERLTGYSHAELMGKSVVELAHPESRAAIQDRTMRRLRGEPVSEEVEIKTVTKDGVDRWISLRGTDSTYLGRPVGMVTAFDITERKRTGEALDHRYRELAAIYTASHKLQKLLTPERLAQEIIEVLEATVKYQYGAVLLVDEASQQLYPFALSDQGRGSEFLEADIALVRSQGIMLSQGVTGWVALHNTPARIDDVRQDSRYFSMRDDVRSELCVPLRIQDRLIGVVNVESPELGAYSEDDQRVLETIATQISVSIQNMRLVEDLSQSRDRLTDLSRRLVQARETESRAIGRELHDQIGQILTALKLTLNLIPRLPPDLAAQKLSGAEELVTDLLERVSRLSLELRPPMLDDLGLIPALLWHVNRFQELTGIAVDFKHSGVEGKCLGSEVETSAYRIVQESLTNVARHANATRLDVQVRALNHELIIKISDNGQGFDTTGALSLNRGLSGIRERAHLLGGTFHIESQAGSGTSKTIHLPLSMPRS